MPILKITNLRKVYGDTVAVDSVSFTVDKNEIVGLLGPNGAGKTTTINMVLAVLEPTAGLIIVEGRNVHKDHEVLASMNFSAVYAQLPGNLTVWQNVYFFGLLYSVKNLKDRIKQLLNEFELGRFAHTKCGLLSSGEQTRVSLVKAMLNKPRLLLLDEPTASLDPSTARTVRERVQRYAKEGESGILWTSHNMQEVTEVCDRVLFLSHGKVLLEGDPKTLPQRHGKKDLEELFITVAREPLSLDI